MSRLPKTHPIHLVDVGAHDGDFAKAIHAYCGVARGILIEPIPAKAARLRTEFKPPVFEVFDCVISDVSGECELNVNSCQVTTSVLAIRKELPELAGIDLSKTIRLKRRMTRLDDLMETTGFSHVHLLKVDVQGAEHLVYAGAVKTLQCTDMLWTEVSFKPLYQGSSLFHEIYHMLGDFGFRLLDLEPAFRTAGGELVQADALFAKV